VVLAVIYAGQFMPPGGDWLRNYKPAILATVTGGDPYRIEGVYNPPWTFAMLAPFALLPDRIARGVLIVVALASFLYVFTRITGDFVTASILAASPQVLDLLLMGNIDWLVIWAYVAPPWAAAILAAIKPQMTIGLFVYWLTKRQWRAMLPVAGLTVASFALYGLWFLRLDVVAADWNASLWPLSIIPGLLLLVHGLKNNRKNWAIGASPLFAPYINFHSWIAAFAFVKSRWVALAVVSASWLYVAVLVLRAI
jgi:hypothetical protein